MPDHDNLPAKDAPNEGKNPVEAPQQPPAKPQDGKDIKIPNTSPVYVLGEKHNDPEDKALLDSLIKTADEKKVILVREGKIFKDIEADQYGMEDEMIYLYSDVTGVSRQMTDLVEHAEFLNDAKNANHPATVMMKAQLEESLLDEIIPKLKKFIDIGLDEAGTVIDRKPFENFVNYLCDLIGEIALDFNDVTKSAEVVAALRNKFFEVRELIKILAKEVAVSIRDSNRYSQRVKEHNSLTDAWLNIFFAHTKQFGDDGNPTDDCVVIDLRNQFFVEMIAKIASKHPDKSLFIIIGNGHVGDLNQKLKNQFPALLVKPFLRTMKWNLNADDTKQKGKLHADLAACGFFQDFIGPVVVTPPAAPITPAPTPGGPP